MINSDDPNLKIWVLENCKLSKKLMWHLFEKGEKIPTGNVIVRLDIDKSNSYLIEMHTFNGHKSNSANWCSLNIGFNGVDLLAENNKIINLKNNKLFSYELIAGSENVTTSLKSLAQYIISSSISDKQVQGFIVQNSRGFLSEFIEFDQEQIITDKHYRESVFKKIDNVMIRDDQFVVAVFI